MKKSTLMLIAFFSITVISCKKNNASDAPSNQISSPFTVKYEITSSSNVYSSYNLPIATYVNSTGQQQTESVPSLSANTPWVKTVTVTSTTRPLQLSLLLSTSPPGVYRLYLLNSGQITQNIYVNGNLVASSTNQSSTSANGSGQFNISTIALNYTIN